MPFTPASPRLRSNPAWWGTSLPRWRVNAGDDGLWIVTGRSSQASGLNATAKGPCNRHSGDQSVMAKHTFRKAPAKSPARAA